MTNIKDLEIDKEILPLLDHTIHHLASDALHALLDDVCHSANDIQYRQQIIQGYIDNWSTVKGFTYPKADLYEVHGFLINFDAPSRLALLVNKKKRQQLRSSLLQCNQLFDRLRRYFKAVPPFNKHIQGIQEVLQSKKPLEIPKSFWDEFFLFEAWFSIAKAHIKYKFCFPVITDGQFTLTDFYHPLVKSPVKNSLVSQSNVLLLTGPNMAGKSTLLKAISICVYLAHLGLGVPATACEIPFFNTISIAINLKDDLENGYSHFLSEIKTLKSVVVAASHGDRCFAVFDELFRGTNLEDAVEISKTTIKGLTKFHGSFFLISTHLHQLKEAIGQQFIQTHYIECHIEKNQPVFTYQLKTGWSTIKIGQLLFEQEGLNRLLSV
jgi:DNA mismatch repair protein MutS